MPTEVIRSIGSGGYYSTLQAWEDDCPANLVTADQVWIGEVLASGIVFSGTGVALTVSGITTDATRHLWLRAAPGASFKDNANKRTNALRYNESNGAFIRYNSSYALCLNINSTGFRLTGLQFRAVNADNYGAQIWGSGSIIEDCIFGNQFRGGLSIGTYTSKPTLRNLLIYSEAGDAGIGLNHSNDPYKGVNIINCTFVRPSALSPSGAAINTEFGQGVVIDNCAFFNFSATAPITGEYPGYTTVRNCATSGSDLGGTFQVETGTVLNLTYANQFEAVTPAGSMDLRTKSGHGLDAGRDTTSFGVTSDITGFARSGTWTIGAWQSGVASISGVLTATLAAATTVATGSVLVRGTTSATLAAATLSAPAQLLNRASASATLSDATLSAASSLLNQGAVSTTLSGVALTATAQLVISGQVSTTLQAAALLSVGYHTIYADVSVTLGDVTLTASNLAPTVPTVEAPPPPMFHDGGLINRMSHPEGAAAVRLSRHLTRRGSRGAQALIEALLGKTVGSKAYAAYPYVVQAANGKTGGLVTIKNDTIIDRVTTNDDLADLNALLNRPTGYGVLPYAGSAIADDQTGLRATDANGNLLDVDFYLNGSELE